MRVVITGADGFVARYLIEFLQRVDPGDEILAMVWENSPPERWPTAKPGLRVIPIELRNAEQVGKIIEEVHPERVFHLAAASSVSRSWEQPAEIYQINIFGQLHLFEALRRLPEMPRVIIASSAEIYGREGHGGRPIAETAPLRPLSPYALTKAAQDLQAQQYFDVFGMPTVRLRLFNHTGPGRPSHFVSSSFARQIAEIEMGLRPPLMKVGNLRVARDFSDVRDVVRAWRLAAIAGVPGEAYNICSERATKIEDILQILLDQSEAKIEVEIDPSLLRPGEIPILFGDSSHFHADTGWKAEIPLEQTLADLLDYWREELAHTSHRFS